MCFSKICIFVYKHFQLEISSVVNLSANGSVLKQNNKKMVKNEKNRGNIITNLRIVKKNL